MSSATLLQEISEKNCSTICRLQFYCRKCMRKTAAQCRLLIYCKKCLRKKLQRNVVCNFTAGNV
jgi:hypothetical protein